MSTNKRPLLPYPEKFKTRFLNLQEVWSISRIDQQEILKAATQSKTELCVAVPPSTPFRLFDADRFNSEFGMPASTKRPNYLVLGFQNYHALLNGGIAELKESSLGFVYDQDGTCEIMNPSDCHEEVVNHPETKFDYRDWQCRWTDWVLRDGQLACSLSVCIDDLRMPCFNLFRYIESHRRDINLSEVKARLEHYFLPQQPSVPNARESALFSNEGSEPKVNLPFVIDSLPTSAPKLEPELSAKVPLKDSHPSVDVAQTAIPKPHGGRKKQNPQKLQGSNETDAKPVDKDTPKQDTGDVEKRSLAEQKAPPAISSSASFLKISQVSEQTGLSESSIDNRCNSKSRYYDPTFPKKRKQGMRSVAWLQSEVTEWVRTREQS